MQLVLHALEERMPVRERQSAQIAQLGLGRQSHRHLVLLSACRATVALTQMLAPPRVWFAHLEHTPDCRVRNAITVLPGNFLLAAPPLASTAIQARGRPQHQEVASTVLLVSGHQLR